MLDGDPSELCRDIARHLRAAVAIHGDDENSSLTIAGNVFTLIGMVGTNKAEMVIETMARACAKHRAGG